MLTKSDYIKYIQCKKNLWLYKNRKDLLPEEIDLNLQRVFEAGYEIEAQAYKLFPGGVSIDEDNIPKAIVKSKQLIDKKTPVIFQPTVTSEILFCRADIIRYDSDIDAWDIIEVKSSTELKDIHIDDLSFQKICFEESGYKIGKIILTHVNNQYVKSGDINPHELLSEVDITQDVKNIEENTKLEIINALEVLKIKDEPDIEILRQCNKPYECSFIPFCWRNFPNHSIYSIAGALGKKKLASLLDEGVMEVKDIPLKYLTSDKLLKHHNAVKNDAVHIETENIKKELANIEYPIYYLDYETFAPAIPIIDGYRPYQRIVFQYSLHVQESINSPLTHFHFLAKKLKDPTRELAKSLSNHIGSKGSVLAWNMGFEKGCNTEMAERSLDYKVFFDDINERMFDLMQIFKKGFYVHKEFHGSASLKKVLPVVVPELDYNKLDISEGMLASNSWGDMMTKDMKKAEKDKIYSNLLEYCAFDTMAMVRILEKLHNV